MAERIAYLEAVVGADITQFRKSMRDIRGDVGILSDVIGGISGAARTMTYAFTAPMVALGTYAVQAASTFDTSMRNINSIAQLPEAQFKALGDQVLEFGKTTRAGAEGAAKALYEVYSAGIFGADAFNIMKIGSKTAEAGLADMTGTIKGLTAAGLTFGDTSEAAMKRYSDATTLAVQLGVGSMDVFNTGISNVIGTGSLLGSTFEDLSATIAFMSQRGISFASAGTYMNNALSKLIKPTTEMSKVFTELHVKSGKELIETFGGIEGALRAVYGKVGASETEWAKLFPDVRGFKAVAPFIKAFKEDGNDAVNSFFDNFDTKMKAGNVTGAAWDQQMMSFSATLDHFKAGLQGVAIVIGQAIIPLITPVIHGVTDILNGISDANPEIVKMAVVFTGVVAAAAPLIWLFTSMISPIGLMIGAVAALSVAFATNFDGIRDKVRNVITAVLGDISPLTDALKDFWKQVFPAMPTAADITGGQKVTINTDDIITIDKPESLWQLYTDKGYDKYFSWTEFMKKAKEGGWDGKGLNIGEKITLPNPDAMDTAKSKLDNVATGLGGVSRQLQILADTDPAKIAPKLSFIDNLSAAIGIAWPKVKAGLAGVWGNITNWVTNTGIPMLDGFGGKILASITGWFAPTQRKGQTEAYGAFRDIFGGGAAKGVQEGVGKLQDNFPQISAGLSAMINSIGAWLNTEGIPTVSRSIGYFVGKIGATFGELLGNIGTYLTGGGAGKDGGKIANGIKGSVVDPAMQGFNDAMKDANVKGGIDSLFSGIAGMLVVGAGVGVLGQMLVGKGFLSAIMSTIGAVFNGTVQIAGGIGNIGLKIANTIANTTAGANLANGMANFGGSVVSAVQDSITKAFSLITSATSWVVTAAGNVALSIGNAIANTTAGAAFANLIANFTGSVSSVIADGLVASIASTTVGASVMGAIAAAIAAAPVLPVILAGLAIVGILSVILPPDVKNTLASLINDVLDPTKGGQSLNKDIPVDAMAEMSKLSVMIPEDVMNDAAKDVYGNINKQLMFITPEDAQSKLGMVTKLEKLTIDYQAGAIDLNDFQSKTAAVINQALNGLNLDTSGDKSEYEGGGYTLPIAQILKPPSQAQAKSVADGMLNPVWVQVAASVTAQAANGNMDTTVLASSMTQPFLDNFTAVFGTTGTATTKFQEFVTDFNTGADANLKKITDMTAKVAAWSVVAIVSNGLAIASFAGYNGIRTLLQGLQSDADKLAGTLNGLVLHSPYKVEIDMVTNGGTPTLPAGAQGSDQGHHATGYSNIPVDNYHAVLHQGESVLDKQSAAVWRAIPQMVANMKPRRDEGHTAKNTTIVINGVQDVDTMLKELDRRGYKIAR